MSPKKLCNYIEGRSNGSNLAEQFRSEKESLLSWSQENDILYSAETFSELQAGEEQYLGGGNEHDVYYDEILGRVVKVTKLPELNNQTDFNTHWNFGAQGSLSAYLTNLENHNKYFGDDIRIEGVLQVGEYLAVISSQPFILGRKATDSEIENWFETIHYQKGLRPQTFIHESNTEDIMIFDARPDNVVYSKSGEIIPIDLQIIVKN
jgi:hypothetical protein